MSKYGYDFDLFGNPEDADEQSDASISNAPISDAPINKDMTSEVSVLRLLAIFPQNIQIPYNLPKQLNLLPLPNTLKHPHNLPTFLKSTHNRF